MSNFGTNISLTNESKAHFVRDMRLCKRKINYKPFIKDLHIYKYVPKDVFVFKKTNPQIKLLLQLFLVTDVCSMSFDHNNDIIDVCNVIMDYVDDVFEIYYEVIMCKIGKEIVINLIFEGYDVNISFDFYTFKYSYLYHRCDKINCKMSSRRLFDGEHNNVYNYDALLETSRLSEDYDQQNNNYYDHNILPLFEKIYTDRFKLYDSKLHFSIDKRIVPLTIHNPEKMINLAAIISEILNLDNIHYQIIC